MEPAGSKRKHQQADGQPIARVRKDEGVQSSQDHNERQQSDGQPAPSRQRNAQPGQRSRHGRQPEVVHQRLGGRTPTAGQTERRFGQHAGAEERPVEQGTFVNQQPLSFGDNQSEGKGGVEAHPAPGQGKCRVIGFAVRFGQYRVARRFVEHPIQRARIAAVAVRVGAHQCGFAAVTVTDKGFAVAEPVAHGPWREQQRGHRARNSGAAQSRLPAQARGAKAEDRQGAKGQSNGPDICSQTHEHTEEHRGQPRPLRRKVQQEVTAESNERCRRHVRAGYAGHGHPGRPERAQQPGHQRGCPTFPQPARDAEDRARSQTARYSTHELAGQPASAQRLHSSKQQRVPGHENVLWIERAEFEQVGR